MYHICPKHSKFILSGSNCPRPQAAFSGYFYNVSMQGLWLYLSVVNQVPWRLSDLFAFTPQIFWPADQEQTLQLYKQCEQRDMSLGMWEQHVLCGRPCLQISTTSTQRPGHSPQSSPFIHITRVNKGTATPSTLTLSIRSVVINTGKSSHHNVENT